MWALVAGGAYYVGKNSGASEQQTAEEVRSSSNYRGNDVRSLGDEEDQRSLASKIARELRSGGVRLSAERVFSLIDPLRKGDEFRTLLSSLDLEGLEELVDFMRTSGLGRENGSEFRMALAAWAQKDPISALNYAEDNSAGNWFKNNILTNWAQFDSRAAEAWAKSNFTGEGANSYMPAVINGIAASDFATADRLLTEMPYSGERGQALNSVISAAVKLGSEEATRWVENIADDQLRAGAIRRLADELARVQPEDAASWVTKLPAGENRSVAIREVADRWVRNDVDAGLAWVDSLSAPEKIEVAPSVAGRIARSDFNRAQEWVSQVDLGDQRGHVMFDIARNGLRGGETEQARAMLVELSQEQSNIGNRAERTLRWLDRRAEAGNR